MKFISTSFVAKGSPLPILYCVYVSQYTTVLYMYICNGHLYCNTYSSEVCSQDIIWPNREITIFKSASYLTSNSHNPESCALPPSNASNCISPVSLPCSAEVPLQFVLKMWQYEIMPCTPLQVSWVGHAGPRPHTWALSLFMCCAAYRISTGGGCNFIYSCWDVSHSCSQVKLITDGFWSPKHNPHETCGAHGTHTAELIGLKGHISFINCAYIYTHAFKTLNSCSVISCVTWNCIYWRTVLSLFHFVSCLLDRPCKPLNRLAWEWWAVHGVI